MRFRPHYLMIALAAFFLFPSFVLAAENNVHVIFSDQLLTSSEYLAAGATWQISNNTDDGLYRAGDGLVLKNDGDAYLVYPIVFSYHDYDRLVMTLASDQPLAITVIPDISSTGYNTYELTKKIAAGNEYQTVNVSLRLPFFKNKIQNLGINFYSPKPSQVTIKEIRLEKIPSSQVVKQAVSDYFLVSPYSPFTVNLFPTPRVFGYSAGAYLLPIVILLLWLLFTVKKWQKIAAVFLLLIWVVIDIRMSYEFLAYNINDYQTFVKPVVAEKTLRTYGDFYQFADWLKLNLGVARSSFVFYNFGSPHFPRVLQYELYPTIVQPEEGTAKTIVVYNRADIKFNDQDKKLYRGVAAISAAGEIVARYNAKSFIFVQP